MLLSLSIANYAIIQQTHIQFDKGLNIITGETGAGKSILMGALGLILGDRADSKSVMQGSDKCVVEASFAISSESFKPFFDQHELDEANPCLIRRELTSTGKSRAFINDTPVTLQVLRELGLQLIDIVSQHETLALNESTFQLQVLDAIADSQEEKKEYLIAFKNVKLAKELLEQLQQTEAGSRQDEDYLRFVLNELQELNPKPGEQEELESRLDELSNADSIQQSANLVNAMLEEGEAGIIDKLREAKSELSAASRHHQGIQQVLQRLDSTLEELKDLASELSHIGSNSHSDPQALAETESRLQLLFHLQKKHKVNTTAELISLKEKFEQQLESLGSLEAEIEKAKAHLHICETSLQKKANALSKKRGKAIPAIEKQVNELLLQVALPNAVFKTLFEPKPISSYSLEGPDQLVFLFSANKGFDPQPINKVASGGELSRLMLCIKSLISDKIELPSIVFDEIDSGISGEAAQKVALVMQKHAQNHQVIAITHLPQIAGKAHQHLFVYKQSKAETTQTNIKKLSPEERVEEIARMLSGENPSEKVLAAARELMGES